MGRHCAFPNFEDFHGFGPHRMRHHKPHHCRGDTEQHFGPHGHKPWGPSPWWQRGHGHCHGPHRAFGHEAHHRPHFHGHHSHGPHHRPAWSRHCGHHHDDHNGSDNRLFRGPLHYESFRGPFGQGPCCNRGSFDRSGNSPCDGQPCSYQEQRPPKKNKPSCSKNKDGNTETVLLQRIVVEHPERSNSV